MNNGRHPDFKQRNLVDSEILGIKIVSLQALAEAFRRHASWKDLADSNSNFVQFLRDVCAIADEDKPQDSFDVEFIDIHKLKVLGLLHCEGSHKEKAFEFYDICQDNFQEKIACNDKDFAAAFPMIFDVASEIVFYWEPVYMANNDPCKVDRYDISSARGTYDDLREEFVDAVFDTESTLTRAQFEELVAARQPWIFQPAEIRKKLYPRVQSWD